MKPVSTGTSASGNSQRRLRHSLRSCPCTRPESQVTSHSQEWWQVKPVSTREVRVSEHSPSSPLHVLDGAVLQLYQTCEPHLTTKQHCKSYAVLRTVAGETCQYQRCASFRKRSRRGRRPPTARVVLQLPPDLRATCNLNIASHMLFSEQWQVKPVVSGTTYHPCCPTPPCLRHEGDGQRGLLPDLHHNRP